MDLTINPHVYPDEGWFFVEDDGTRLQGGDLDDLVGAVRTYRMISGKAMGDPETDVVEFTCRRFPSACRKKPGIVSGGNSDSAFMSRVVQWLVQLHNAVIVTRRDVLVARPVAEERASVCRQCPFQRDWRRHCVGCSSHASTLGTALRKGRDVTDGDQLHGCDLLHEDTRTSVWLDGLKPVDSDELPDHCWRKLP